MAERIADAFYPSLNNAEAQSANRALISEFPKVIRGDRDPPITQQSHGNVSFLLLKAPRKQPDGKSIVGFFKLRGNWADINQCKQAAAKIIREQDSMNKIRVAEVGVWFPITDGDGQAESVDVNTNIPAEEEKIKAEAIKTREEEKNRIARELKEREQEVKDAKDINDDPESLDYYVMKRVVWLRLQENIEQYRTKTEDLEKKWRETRKLLDRLEVSHPGFEAEWIDRYNEERRKSKIPDYIPSEEQDGLYKKKIVE